MQNVTETDRKTFKTVQQKLSVPQSLTLSVSL